ncbi:MAG: serine hydrolase [Ruminococcaceae bacterium]|nr:serine hydrolase [Oscillospiraceae bacterium]
MKGKTQALIEALKQDNPGVEAVALYQDGEMVLTHYFKPHLPRLIYSHTKSFISTAAGIAIDEGKLSLNTEVGDLFPEYLPKITDERVGHIKLRHFLTMSSGFGEALVMDENRRNGEAYPDYVGYILGKELKYPSGEAFCYSNGDSHMVGCMVQRATGVPLLQYCYDRFFSKMGIGFPVWETDPQGTAFGGSGLYLTITDMMKLGILYLHNGVWEGERLLSEEWVKAAASKQIVVDQSGQIKDDYGYQFWISGQREGVFRADGAYGQTTMVLPKENAVFATQCSEFNDVPKFKSMVNRYINET